MATKKDTAPAKKKARAKPKQPTPKRKGSATRRKPETGVTELEEQFCRQYLIKPCGATAYRRAGGEGDPGARVAEMMKRPRVKRRLAELMAEREKRLEFDADRVLQEFSALAFFDPADLFGDDGELLDIHQMDPIARRAVAGLKVRQLYKGQGDAREEIGTLTEVKLINRNEALRSLGRHLQLFNDKVELGADRSLRALLDMIDGTSVGPPSERGK